MPDMDRVTACQIINGTDCLRGIPIIMLTVMNNADFLVKAFDAGAADYIIKPVKEAELLAREGAPSSSRGKPIREKQEKPSCW